MATLRTRYWADIQAAAKAERLDPILVEAICVQESAGNTDAFRFERDYWNRYMKTLPEFATANPRRVSSSYGLMQIMYQVARERGFLQTNPPEYLFIPAIGLEFGCKQLRHLQDRMDLKYPAGGPFTPAHLLRALLASYNGGFQGPDALRPRNAQYADLVLQHLSQLTTEHAA